MIKTRLEFLAHVINQDFTTRHDVPQMHFRQTDLRELIEDAGKLNEIKKVMGLSHADSFDVRHAVKEIKNILDFN